MLYIDDGAASDYRWPFHTAAERFGQMHQSERLYVWSSGIGLEGFRVSIRTQDDARPSPLVVRVGSDPEEAILTALEKWWAERSKDS